MLLMKLVTLELLGTTKTCLFVKWIDANQFETIEGNTSLTNDSNGGQVMKRIRNKKTAIFVCI